jgi:hypothetical protein
MIGGLLVIVPAEVVVRLREALYSVLGDEASEVAALTTRRDREKNGGWFTEHIARFKQACAILDAIGWSETRGIVDDADVPDEHEGMMLFTLKRQLETEHYLVKESPGPGSPQHRKASRYASVIERFLSEWEDAK